MKGPFSYVYLVHRLHEVHAHHGARNPLDGVHLSQRSSEPRLRFLLIKKSSRVTSGAEVP